MTTRLDHTNCTHDRTPAGRKACRTRRDAMIRAAQQQYTKVEENPNFDGQREYEAMVELFAGQYGIELTDAYQLIENGPVVY